MIGEIHETKQGQVETGEGFCNFLLFQTYHVFQTEVLKRDDKQVEVKLSPTINRLLRRETLRIESQEREYELKVTLDCKLLNQSFTDDQVLDYSEHGISLMDIDQKYAFPKGMPIEEIAIEVKGKPAIKGHGRVRNYVWNSDKKTYVVGIHFEANGEPHLTNWHNFILKARYPMLEFNYCPDEYQKIWDLFERSKYLGLKPRESFDYVYDFSKKTWENMSKAGSYFSKRILLKKDGSIVGHLQFDRLYPKTWCVHALAIDPTAQKMLGKEIYSVTSDLLLFQGDAYIISITETELTWNEKNYYKFVETYPTEGHNQIKVFQIHEAEIEKGWDLNTSSQYNIRLANKYDLAMIANYIELNFDPIEITALSLDKDNLELDEFNSACEKHGLTRYRKFLVALKNGKIKGFSILETGSTGLSIFGIQDTMYIYIVDDIPEKQRLELHDSLLNDSLLFYKGLNIPTVNIYMEKPMREYYSDKNIKFVWEGSRWIAKAEASKKYHAFTQNLYGHLLLKREIIRKKAKKSEK